jgi:deazaflavin-dependent oxidoreductase (nitroreductase family)
MSSSYQGSEELLARTGDFVADHRNLYLSSGGGHGHIMNFAHVGVDKYLPSLLLQTIGRKSGNPSIVPLIYGCHAGEWVVVGSKGGTPEHPAWFLNLREMERCVVQIATQAYVAEWRSLEGNEYQHVWDYMAEVFPPYLDYRKAVEGGRTIPVVKLLPVEPAPLLCGGP